MDARQSSHENANTIGSKTVRMPNADMAAPPKNPYTMDYFGNKGFSVLSENPPSLYVSPFARSATMASPASQGKLLGTLGSQPPSILSTEYRSRSRAAQNWNAPVRLYQELGGNHAAPRRRIHRK